MTRIILKSAIFRYINSAVLLTTTSFVFWLTAIAKQYSTPLMYALNVSLNEAAA